MITVYPEKSSKSALDIAKKTIRTINKVVSLTNPIRNVSVGVRIAGAGLKNGAQKLLGIWN